jgi:hypothetical protein
MYPSRCFGGAIIDACLAVLVRCRFYQQPIPDDSPLDGNK